MFRLDMMGRDEPQTTQRMISKMCVILSRIWKPTGVQAGHFITAISKPLVAPKLRNHCPSRSLELGSLYLSLMRSFWNIHRLSLCCEISLGI
jgi:hypothetical protein